MITMENLIHTSNVSVRTRSNWRLCLRLIQIEATIKARRGETATIGAMIRVL